MLTKNTTLILGAGASIEFGYPLGLQLKDRILQICELCLKKNDLNANKKKVPLPDVFRIINQRFNYSINFIKNFYTAFRYSKKVTIDAFLEDNSEFFLLGKVMIALAISSCEECNTCANNRNNWYEYIIGHILNNGKLSNKLKVITFNYDRSFEYYFTQRLIILNKGDIDKSIAQFRESIPLIHVHGRLGSNPFYKNGIPYSQLANSADILEAITNISIIHEEQLLYSTIYHKVYNLLNSSEQIFILGFGFDKRNLFRLRLHELSIPIYATRLGISDSEIHSISEIAKNKIYFGKENNTILDFFLNEVSINGKIWGQSNAY